MTEATETAVPSQKMNNSTVLHHKWNQKGSCSCIDAIKARNDGEMASAEESCASTTGELDGISSSDRFTTGALGGKVATAPPLTHRWSSIKEALEACLDANFLVSQADGRGDTAMVAEVQQRMDGYLSIHVPQLLELELLQPFFTGAPRSEQLDCIVSAVRSSRRLVLRDDLPVPSAEGLILSIDEAEAASLRVGPRSHSSPSSRCTLLLEQLTSDATAPDSCSITKDLLQPTLPHLPILQCVAVSAPSKPKSSAAFHVTFLSPTAAQRAKSAWAEMPPLPGVKVSFSSSSTSGSRAVPQPPQPLAVAAAPSAVGGPRQPAIRCPRVVGEVASRPASHEDLSSLVGATARAVHRMAPPPAIDASLVESQPQQESSAAARTSAAAARDTSGLVPPSALSVSGSGAAAPSRGFNHDASPFLPKSIAGSLGLRGRSPWPGKQPMGPWWGSASPADIDTSEALANQMLLDSSTGWMHSTLDPYAPAWTGMSGTPHSWAAVLEHPLDSPLNSPGAYSSFPVQSAVVPAAAASSSSPAVHPVMPVPPCAIDASPSTAVATPLQNTAASATPIIPPEKGGSSIIASPADQSVLHLQTTATNTCGVVRHRHDPYGATGYVLCTDCTSYKSPTLLSAASTNSINGEMLSFCYQDPLLTASRMRREKMQRRRLSACSSCEEEEEEGITSSQQSITAPLTTTLTSSSSGGSANDVADLCVSADASPCPAGQAAAPRSYAEALRSHKNGLATITAKELVAPSKSSSTAALRKKKGKAADVSKPATAAQKKRPANAAPPRCAATAAATRRPDAVGASATAVKAAAH